MHNAADLAVDTFPVGRHHGADQVVRTALHRN